MIDKPVFLEPTWEGRSDVWIARHIDDAVRRVCEAYFRQCDTPSMPVRENVCSVRNGGRAIDGW